jgi:histidinol-phosphate aminotransferase
MRTQTGSMLSRREWARKTAAFFAAGAAVPAVTEYALAQDAKVFLSIPEDAIRLNANENPMGPCPAAIEAVKAVAPNGGRYHFGMAGKLVETIAEVEGVDPNFVMPFAGSSDPLHRVVLAYTSPTRPLVHADPGFEAPAFAAKFVGARVIPVPLAKDYTHDAGKMLAADPTPGVIYVCNPNNPTGTVTKKGDIERIVSEKPNGCMVLVDEAYIHFSKSAESCKDLVAKGKDVVVLRTFSKLYGMAGLRAGFAMARPDVLERLKGFTGFGILPATGLSAAVASLKDKNLVPMRQKLLADIRDDLFGWLAMKNYGFIPSEANMVMVDGKRPGPEVVAEVVKHKVAIGRSWPSMPNHVRVTIGTRDEMAKFKAAFEKVMG